MSKLPFGLKIGLFYFIAYLLTGIFFLLQVSTGINGIYVQFPQIGPALAAVIFIILEGGSLKRFFKKGFRFTLNRYTVGMLLTTILLTLSVSVLTTYLWGAENLNRDNMNLSGVFFALSTVIAALCEEIGWRGYLLTRLQTRMTPMKASLILGILWGFWHAPRLLMGVPFFAAWFIGIIGLTFILTYAFNRTGGNIWAVTLIHSVVNLMANFFLFGFVTDIRINLANSISYILWAIVVVMLGRKHINMKAENIIEG